MRKTDLNLLRELTLDYHRKDIPARMREIMELMTHRKLVTDEEVIQEVMKAYKMDVNPIDAMMNRLDEMTDVMSIVRTLNPDNADFLGYFSSIYECLSLKDYSQVLAYIYRNGETGRWNTKLWCNLFRKAKTQDLMNEEDYAVYMDLPKELTVYRGCVIFDGDEKEAVCRLSWTLDKDKAYWFAERQITKYRNEYAAVYEAKISKSKIFMYTDERNEHEVIVDVCKQNISAKKIAEFKIEDYPEEE